jgi:hypothetical protein
MKNITVAVPESTYIRARVWAAEHETSVSSVVAYLLYTLPGIKRAAAQFPRRSEKPPTANNQPPTTDDQPVTPPPPPPRHEPESRNGKLVKPHPRYEPEMSSWKPEASEARNGAHSKNEL